MVSKARSATGEEGLYTRPGCGEQAQDNLLTGHRWKTAELGLRGHSFKSQTRATFRFLQLMCLLGAEQAGPSEEPGLSHPCLVSPTTTTTHTHPTLLLLLASWLAGCGAPFPDYEFVGGRSVSGSTLTTPCRTWQVNHKQPRDEWIWNAALSAVSPTSYEHAGPCFALCRQNSQTLCSAKLAPCCVLV